jgi:hypothetical protein
MTDLLTGYFVIMVSAVMFFSIEVDRKSREKGGRYILLKISTSGYVKVLAGSFYPPCEVCFNT